MATDFENYSPIFFLPFLVAKRLKREERGYRVRIRNHLVAKYFPELDRYYEQSERYGLVVVRWCLNPRVLSPFELEKFVQVVAPGKRGRESGGRLRGIWELARGSLGCKMGPAAEFEARVMVDGLKRTREVIVETDRQILERCMEFAEYECLLSIPGFGPDVSAKVLGAIGDPFRFQNGKQV
jgi:hypothetical protein